MITVINIGQRHGYTGHDHMISDSELHELIGRPFRSLADLKRTAAYKRAEAPVWVEYQIGCEVREVTI